MLNFKHNNPIYIVQKGDTLYSIAKNNNISVESIIEKNNLNSSNLYIGQELYIPAINENSNEKNNDNNEYEIYTIKKGDSLWKISREYGITIPQLKEINNLEDFNIIVGQKILVPKKEQTYSEYIVQKGDSLW